MTRDQYFEMCEALGSEPLEEEIPIELEDLPHIVVDAFKYYRLLRDIWDPMGGNYLGKDLSIIFDIFEAYKVDPGERIFTIELLQYIDTIRSKIISDKKAQATSLNEPPKS